MALAFYLYSHSARSTAKDNLNNLIVETPIGVCDMFIIRLKGDVQLMSQV